MSIKRILLYFLLITFFQSYPQLNQQSKKITKKFFSDLNELEDVTPALKKKKDCVFEGCSKLCFPVFLTPNSAKIQFHYFHETRSKILS